jgi:hypothetical protein
MAASLQSTDNDININMDSDDAINVPVIRMYIKNVTGKGRGVYAGENIPSRTLINISPVLLFPESGTTEDDYSSGSSSCSGSAGKSTQCSCSCPERDILAHYTYSFGGNQQALALGMGSMFNHAKRNNVGFVLDKTNLLIRYTTGRQLVATCVHAPR